MTPVISVVMPTHNRRQLMLRALASVLGQTLREIEVIVVENACNDGTAEALDAIKDPRIRRVSLPEKCGASAARNAGIRIAAAPLLAFQDDDDFWFPDKLEKQHAALQAAEPETGLCLCGFIRLNPQGPSAHYAHYFFDQIDFSRGIAQPDFSVIATPGWLLKRAALNAAGPFDEQLPARNDWEMGLRLRDVCSFTYVAEPLFIQDQRHVSSMMWNKAAFSSAMRRIMQIHEQRWQATPVVLASHAEIIARWELSEGSPGEGRTWAKRALRWHAWNPRLAMLYLLSYAGTRNLNRARALKQRLIG